MLLINAEVKKINEKREIKQIVVLLSSEDYIPKGWALLTPDLCPKDMRWPKFLIPSTPISVEEREVNIHILHSLVAECSENNIQCVGSIFHSDLLKPLQGWVKYTIPILQVRKLKTLLT